MGNEEIKFQQIKKLKNGQGLEYLLNEIGKILNNPVLIFDLEYNLIAHSHRWADEDPISMEFMLHGKLSDTTLELCRNEGFIDYVSACTDKDGVAYLISDKLKHDRIFGQIYNNQQMPVADLVMVEYDSDFTENIAELIKAACSVISREIGNAVYYQVYGQSYQERIVKRLIENTIEDRTIYTGHVANVDRGFMTNLFVLVMDISRCKNPELTLQELRDLCMAIQPEYKYFVYGQQIVSIVSSESLVLRGELDKLKELFERENIYTGISNYFENLFEMHIYYNEAIQMLKKALSLGTKHLFFADEQQRFL